MGNALKILSGYKTYIGTILIAVIGISWKAEWIDTDTAGAIAAVVTAFTGAALRSAVAKNGMGK